MVNFALADMRHQTIIMEMSLTNVVQTCLYHLAHGS
jgi:hypothetical protein